MPILETYDPLNVPASKEDVNDVREIVLNLPVEVEIEGIGFVVVDADNKSLEAMKETLFDWSSLDIEYISWRMSDNKEVSLSEDQLEELYYGIKAARAKRRFSVFKETSEMKEQIEKGIILTKRMLEQYIQSYKQ